MDLQIAVNSAEGLGILRPQRPGFGKRKEVLPDFGNFPLKLRRLSQPIDDLPIQIWAYTGEYCKALPATANFLCPFRPQKGTACGAPERPLQRFLCMFTARAGSSAMSEFLTSDRCGDSVTKLVSEEAL